MSFRFDKSNFAYFIAIIIIKVILYDNLLNMLNLTLKAPFTTAAEHKFCDVFPDFLKK